MPRGPNQTGVSYLTPLSSGRSTFGCQRSPCAAPPPASVCWMAASMWTGESGKPFLVTEWYTKGEDSGYPNTSGAGWNVPTQRDRGWFYQNFTLALLESKNGKGTLTSRYLTGQLDAVPKRKRRIPRTQKGTVRIHSNPVTRSP